MSYNDYFKEAGKDTSLEEKIAVIKGNITEASKIRKEINEWGTLQQVGSTIIPEDNSNSLASDNESKVDPKIEKIYHAISLLDIEGLSEDEITVKLKDIFKDGIDYLTINRIKLLLYKEYIIYNRMLLEKISDSAELNEITNALNSLKIKLDLLDELEEDQELIEAPEVMTNLKENNNIYFLLSDTGKVIALESLRKNVPIDYYQAIKELILSLKSGELKDVKKLSFKNCYELRGRTTGPGIRIFFDRLSNGNYIVLDIFMKKIYRIRHDIHYRSSLDNRVNQYLNKKESYFNRIEDPKFIKEHEGYLAEILSLLDNKTLEENSKNETRSI